MSATPDAVYVAGLDFFGAVVSEVPSGAWDAQSPCEGWRARDVLGHIGAGVRFGTALLGGASPVWTPIDPPGDAVEGDPATWWAGLVPDAKRAVEGVDLTRVVDSPVGRRTIAEGLTFPAVDLFVHAWDLGRAVGLVVEIPDGVIDFATAVSAPLPAEQIRNPRVFAAEVEPPPGATRSEAFLAWTGRDPRG